MAIHYSEHRSSPALADAVECYWTITDSPAGAELVLNTNLVLPDNCIDVIFDLRASSQSAGIVVGAMLQAEAISHDPDVDMLGVRFHPGAAVQFLDLNASELTGRDLNASDAWRDAGTIQDRLRTAIGPARFAILDQFLQRRRQPRRDASLARQAMAAIESLPEIPTVGTLSHTLRVTNRTLERAFETSVGLAPKLLLRVRRFRTAASLLTRIPGIPLARIAAVCGYADQAHMTREFREFAGLTPTAFRRERRLVGFIQDQTEPGE